MFSLLCVRRLRDVTVLKISWKLPPGLENLPNIQRVLLSSNYLNGEIPSTVDIALPKELAVMRISDLSGRETHKKVFEAMKKDLLRGFSRVVLRDLWFP
ncbi:hypothetical protein AALP_AAs41143U000200 [Arabis alpina]|uniref:Uncharacterized protein n=1 Tax=Arabis alpina TaxID=50452 RepID=A0A087FYB1_ARAAL|nr:hypothetical protein AALP_AAs41143U000200 [Arabis alpina]